MFYTLDGSTPTSASTLYNGSFSVTVPAGGSVTVNAVTYNPMTGVYSAVTTSVFRGYGWKAGDTWFNTNDGAPTQGFSGNIVLANGRYYMAGQNMLAPDRTLVCCGFSLSVEGQTGVWLYSSADLYNWRSEGQILNNPANWYEITRPHIVWNASTSQYVLWAHCSAEDLSQQANNRACTATASSITGPWTWQNTSFDPDGFGYKDCYLFVDDDGTGYTIYAHGSNDGIVVSKLAADYLSTSGAYLNLPMSSQEAPVLFKRGGVYFLIHGDTNLYSYVQDIQQSYRTASAPLGTWSADSPLFATDPAGTAFNGQPASVYQVPGKTDGFLYIGDAWQQPVSGSTHVFLPLVFPDSVHAQAETPATWDLNTFQ